MHQSILLAVLFYVFTVALGDSGITPTAPGPGDKFKAGSLCTIQWQPGNWSEFSITLMSGSNLQMQPVKLVASDLNGSDASVSSYNWTCPEVDPYSAIYFYQFTEGNDTANSKWTTRFTITSPSGDSTPPPNATQSNGDAIPWGFGSLRNSTFTSTATAATTPSTPTTSFTSSGMRKSKSATATSTKRQPTPTLNVPSSPTATDSPRATSAANPVQTGGAMVLQAIRGWMVLSVILIPSYFFSEVAWLLL
ncbi:hypothetical protein GYMLUDRAFT_155635 [Collybiopsis luxurians FD-317 M1]|nr:hypothetical protein GYMLUDRAFT_155635 [Collybiopsis luxurians FD-317 M1]